MTNFAMLTITVDGFYFYDENHKLHNDSGPAIQLYNVTKKYFIHGRQKIVDCKNHEWIFDFTEKQISDIKKFLLSSENEQKQIVKQMFDNVKQHIESQLT